MIASAPGKGASFARRQREHRPHRIREGGRIPRGHQTARLAVDDRLARAAEVRRNDGTAHCLRFDGDPAERFRFD